jgi:hypothetical protein
MIASDTRKEIFIDFSLRVIPGVIVISGERGS